ncbi:MAG TPA: HAMP domain-containing sensor histidine kinase [Verrucomicrobiae bacterium]
MRKVALVFVLAVLVPSLVLAWLAVRSLRDQQFLLERQQSLLYQRVTDSLAQNISGSLAQRQQEFSAQVENLAGQRDAREVAAQFDDELRRHWPLADVGFCVTLSGKILSPSTTDRSEAKSFFLDNSAFLGNRETAEVYGNRNGAQNSIVALAGLSSPVSRSDGGAEQKSAQPTLAFAPAAAPVREKIEPDRSAKESLQDKIQPTPPQVATAPGAFNEPQQQNSFNYKAQTRKVSPQSAAYGALKDSSDATQDNLSKVVPAEAEFAQLIGDGTDGMLARFLQNKLKLMFWHRLNREPDLIFGAQLNLDRVVDGLRGLVQPEPALRDEICLALLDDNARPIVISRAGFQANWKRPFVATEIGDALPHWEIAAYLVDPAALTRAVCIANITFGLLIVVLVLAIVIGSWLIVRNLNIELTLARQKTDFVSNVSHELKTPLTSIRMFSELLAEGRVADTTKQRSYLNIITAEAARLTRLINNVLDFSRMERGEKKYDFSPCDLTEIVRSTAETFRPHLEANGFKFDCELPEAPVSLRADADALSQIIVNLLSNAEKYSTSKKEITLRLAQKLAPLPHAEIRVLDRGSGIPRGSEEKVFEKFYRAHDSLSSGIQGSGLGLTIARQIARAHGGDVVYEPRDGGGSCFILRLPLKIETTEGHG